MKKSTVVRAEATPNPHSMKFKVNQVIANKPWSTADKGAGSLSPLAQKIMGFPWVQQVFIDQDFITINKEDWVKWDTLIEPLADMIKEHIDTGQSILLNVAQGPKEKFLSAGGSENPLGTGDQAVGEDQAVGDFNSEQAQAIKQVLDKDIQPAVAMDGGFIAFAGYKEGQVFLKMQGACSGCPSASMTLKQGIEVHLKKHLSFVKEVIAL